MLMGSGLTERGQWFAEHVLPHEPKVRVWLRRAGWNDEEIEDMIQESYARLAATATDQIHNPGAFFFQTARNVAAGVVRRRRIVSIRSVANIEEVEVADNGLDAEARLSAYEDLVRLKAAIETLPEACRRVFVMRKIEGVSQAETARRLGVTESNVEKHVARGLRLCAAALTAPAERSGIPGLLARTFWKKRLGHDGR